MTTHAIMGTDLSNASAKLVVSSDEFKKLGIKKITLVHVLNLRDSQMMLDFSIDKVEKDLEKQKQILLQNGFEVNAEVIYGIPSVELEQKSREVDAELIIVGSNGLNWSSSVLGSTASELLHTMKAPILPMVMKQIKSQQQLESQKNLYQYEKILRGNSKSGARLGVVLPRNYQQHFTANRFLRFFRKRF